MKLFIASDHAGFDLKEELKKLHDDIEWTDLGPDSDQRVDYPDYADKVARAIIDDPKQMGVLICGSGQGMAIKANRYPQIRAALCWNEDIAILSRGHNDANILCLGARHTTADHAADILTAFINAEFEGGRHLDRVKKLGK
ncbi:MAG: ribose 5-phosphate isomerase B [Bdellovibrionales bacterium]|nr:ribose 5-phosphate isomerase B [Bdellovibrionales bacterium]